MIKKRPTEIRIDPNPKGERKCIGGADHDQWNDWLARVTASALPVNQKDEAATTEAINAVFSGMIDMKPADPIEGILISQLMAANQASLSMYQRAWSQPPEYLDARMKYLTIADKAARTASMLTERLDQHRGRGHQQIVVKHVTVNADQAVVTDNVVSGKPLENTVPSPTLLTDPAENPMSMDAKMNQCDDLKPAEGGGGENKK